MDLNITGLVYLVVGALLGGLAIWLILHVRLEAAEERGRQDSAIELTAIKERLQASQSELDALKQKLNHAEVQAQALRDELDRIGMDRATLAERASRVPQLDEQVAEREGRINELRRETGLLSNQLAEKKQAVEGLMAQLTELQNRIIATEQERNQIRRDRDELTIRVAELTTTLQAEREQGTEKLALLSGAREELTTQFKNLANEILEDKSQRFTVQNKENLDALLNPLRERIKDFQTKVEEVYDKESRERLTLQTEITRLAELNTRIGEDAVNLTRALKGDTKTQGSWGEIVLERVLESSGLRKGEEYIVQGSFADAEGMRSQPDVVVNLPERKNVVIDSKVSLTAYERYCSTEDGSDRESALKQHLASVRAHVNELSGKSYQTLYELHSLDFVLMFVPVEPAFMLAVQADRDVFLDAFKLNVVIVSPSTLLAMLRTIANIWRQEHQSRNAQEIARQCASLYDKFVGFVEDLEEIGRKLAATQRSYDDARGKLATGRGNLIRQAERVKELGVKPTKNLPRNLVDSATESAKGGAGEVGSTEVELTDGVTHEEH